jgi:hypothetical protein
VTRLIAQNHVGKHHSSLRDDKDAWQVFHRLVRTQTLETARVFTWETSHGKAKQSEVHCTQSRTTRAD